jgi:hypothetical protein
MTSPGPNSAFTSPNSLLLYGMTVPALGLEPGDRR